MIRATVTIEVERDDLKRYLEDKYSGPPDDPAPDALEWCRDVFGDMAVRALEDELGHVDPLRFRLVEVVEVEA